MQGGFSLFGGFKASRQNSKIQSQELVWKSTGGTGAPVLEVAQPRVDPLGFFHLSWRSHLHWSVASQGGVIVINVLWTSCWA